ncbi:endospore germination permease [Paenibacillus sp. SYP-B4298]|uniref:endospore germination permease n=1 Tax=Paenibacillus sp. SYP-B4298 TaxID=2996034 RepID=UPI0022DCF2BB|nr:endospore germination permease [Paenibacillus sp. SYP-B4298]
MTQQSTGHLSYIQLVMIVMLVNGLMSHVIINPMLLEASQRDAWLAVIAATMLILPWCALIAWCMRRSGQQKLQPWLATRVGSFLSWLIVLPFSLQLYLMGGTTVLHTSGWTLTNYLPDTPVFILALSLCIVCFYYACTGLRTIAISAGLMLPVVVALGFFVSFANNDLKDMELLRPVLENGLRPVWHGTLYAVGGFSELILLFALQHRIRQPIRGWQLVLLGALLASITLGPVIGAITEFGPVEAAKQMESPYEQWRLVRLGYDLEHVDFLSVFQWLAGAVIRISLSIFLLAELMPWAASGLRRGLLVGAITLSYTLLSLIPLDAYTFYLYMYRYYVPYSLVAALAMTAWYVLLCLLPDKSEVKAS